MLCYANLVSAWVFLGLLSLWRVEHSWLENRYVKCSMLPYSFSNCYAMLMLSKHWITN